MDRAPDFGLAKVARTTSDGLFFWDESMPSSTEGKSFVIVLPARDSRLLSSEVFLKDLIENRNNGQESVPLCTHLAWQDIALSERILALCGKHIEVAKGEDFRSNSMLVIFSFLFMADGVRKQRIGHVMKWLLFGMSHNLQYGEEFNSLWFVFAVATGECGI